MNTDLIKYYKNRAAEYEKIYYNPERQNDLAAATTTLQNIFTGKEVLEIGCGTGFWTEKISVVASTVVATDINQSVLNVAQKKNYVKANVAFEIADMFQYQPSKKFETVFGGFIWSHIYLQHIDSFLETVNNYVMPGGTIVFMDNNYVEKSNLPITHRDELGNTFQKRKLDDNTSHLVLKNFPAEAFIRGKLKDVATDILFIHLTYYWLLVYKAVN